MREDFEITGLFYEEKGYKFRKYLNIIKLNSNSKKPDLMVVMMNPGSSKPTNEIDDNNVETKAVPDNTQTQIMRIMKNCEFNYARILNLSDLREPKSSVFYGKIEELEKQNISHSIFANSRIKDYENLFIKNIPVIYAWGVNKKLTQLAIASMNRIGKINSIGIKKKGFEYAYYHPLPRSHSKQKEWEEQITEIIKTA